MTLTLVILLIVCKIVFGDQDIILLHDNDIMSRFDEIQQNGQYCFRLFRDKKLCMGGISRLAKVLKDNRELQTSTETKVLYFSTGGIFTGTAYYYVFKSKIAAEIVKILKPDVLTISYNEFSEGVEGLAEFITDGNVTVLAANLDVSNEPALKDKIKKSMVMEVGPVRIGVIGFVSHNLHFSSVIGNCKVQNVVEAIEVECKALMQQGVKIIIAVGSGGYDLERQIALSSEHVDIVVGGGTRTLLYNGIPEDPSIEVTDAYPKVLQHQLTGKKVGIVRTAGYTQYLGRLNFTVDSTGLIESWVGQPIYLSKDTPKDDATETVLEKYRPEIRKLESEIIGTALVYLEGGKDCKIRECNLANFITDAIASYATSNFPPEKGWSSAPIAIINAASVSEGMETSFMGGNISFVSLLQSMPINSEYTMFSLKGEYVLRLFERSASTLEQPEAAGRGAFLHFSGIRVMYDTNLPTGSRVTSAEILCARCAVPRYYTVMRNETYRMVTSLYLLKGSYGYVEFKKSDENVTNIGKAIDIVKQHIKNCKSIYPELNGRILIELPHTTARAPRFLDNKSVSFIFFIPCTLVIHKFIVY